MTLTRDQSEKAFQHIVTNIWGHGSPTSPLKLVLESHAINDMADFFSLDYVQIEEMEYFSAIDDGSRVKVELSRGHRNLMHLFKRYVLWRKDPDSEAGPIGDDWLGITKQDFDDFRMRIPPEDPNYFVESVVGETNGFPSDGNNKSDKEVGETYDEEPTDMEMDDKLTEYEEVKDEEMEFGDTENGEPTNGEKGDVFQDSWCHDFAIQAKDQDLDNGIDLFPSYFPEEEIVFEDADDLDTLVAIVEANANETRLAFAAGQECRRPISMRVELVPNARCVWDPLTDADKVTILGNGELKDGELVDGEEDELILELPHLDAPPPEPPPLGKPVISTHYDDATEGLNALALVFSMKGSDNFSTRLDRPIRPRMIAHVCTPSWRATRAQFYMGSCFHKCNRKRDEGQDWSSDCVTVNR